MKTLAGLSSITASNLRSIPRRIGPSAVAVIGVAGTVILLSGVLSIGAGLAQTLAGAGRAERAIVLAAGASSELASRVPDEHFAVAAAAPGVARVGARPVASPEVLVLIDWPLRGSGTLANLPVRGLTDAGRSFHEEVRITQGRWFEPGSREAIVGRVAARQYAGTEIGTLIGAGNSTWRVVGVFDSGGSAAESEIWTDAALLQQSYRREAVWQSLHVVLDRPESFEVFRRAIVSDPRLQLTALTETRFLADQTGAVIDGINRLGMLFAGIMALASLFAVASSMHSALASRTREICTLRAIGFRPATVAAALLAEGLMLGLLGGCLGACVAYFAFNGQQAYTLSTVSLTTVGFDFAVTPAVAAQGLLWALGLGLLGAAPPALRAARMPICAGLRDR